MGKLLRVHFSNHSEHFLDANPMPACGVAPGGPASHSSSRRGGSHSRQPVQTARPSIVWGEPVLFHCRYKEWGLPISHTRPLGKQLFHQSLRKNEISFWKEWEAAESYLLMSVALEILNEILFHFAALASFCGGIVLLLCLSVETPGSGSLGVVKVKCASSVPPTLCHFNIPFPLPALKTPSGAVVRNSSSCSHK